MPKDHIVDDQSSFSVLRNISVRQCFMRSSAGFTLVELIVVSGIIGVLATIGFPAYQSFVNHAKNARAMSEIRLLETEVNDYQVQNGMLPVDLVAIGRGTLRDPWGNLYVFNDFRDLGTTPARRYLADPLNHDYDLFSKGEDGESEESVHVLGVGNLGSDDLVRGSDGAFLGTGAGWVGE